MPSPSRFTAIASTFLACAAIAACNGSKPTAPTTPTATVTALAIGAPPASTKAGDTFQLTVTATLSNGQSTTSGFTVTWSSSDANVATVSGTGLVTAKADGDAKISASSNAVSASVDFRVRGGRTLTGLVTETAPTTSTAVAGARVTVADGLYAGAGAITDSRGAFSLTDVNGVLNLRISAPNFDDLQITADTAASAPLTLQLMPSSRTITDSAQWSVPYGDPRQVEQGSMTFSMHRGGRVDLSTGGDLTAGESAPLCSELRDEQNALLWSYKIYYQFPAQQTMTLDGGKRYTLKVTDCGWAGHPIMHAYRLAATHPY